LEAILGLAEAPGAGKKSSEWEGIMTPLTFGRFRIERDDDNEFPYSLYDENDIELGVWKDAESARFDIDNSPLGEEITLDEWQALWDWVEPQ